MVHFTNPLPASIRSLLTYLLSIICVGCAFLEPPTQIKDIDVTVKERTLVYGTVKLFKGTKPVTCDMLYGKQSNCWLVILTPESKQPVIYRIKEDGSFIWGLTPGEYVILGFDGYSFKGHMSNERRIWTKFSVPKEVKGLYIGELKIDVIAFRLEIEDNFDATIDWYKTRLPNTRDLPKKQLMELEPKVGSYETIRRQCDKDMDWNIKRSPQPSQYCRIRPLQPEQPKSMVGPPGIFPTVDSLTPTFEWSPSLNEEITYDLVVYEVINYYRYVTTVLPLFKFDTPSYIPGSIAVYEEGITESKLTLNGKLKPGRNYFWSVRFRKGDVVSTWSLQPYQGSYFIFYYNIGELFSFSTPGKTS